MFDKEMEEDGLMDKKAKKVEEFMAILAEGMGGDLKDRYRPASAAPEEDAEDLLEEGASMAGGNPMEKSLEEDEPSEEDLKKVLLMVLGGE